MFSFNKHLLGTRYQVKNSRLSLSQENHESRAVPKATRTLLFPQQSIQETLGLKEFQG